MRPPVPVGTNDSEYPIYQAGLKRSGRWPAVRKKHLKQHPACEICGATSNLNVHHIQPFHLNPELELKPDNLVTLCEGTVVNCHYFFGHLLDWSNFNAEVLSDIERYRGRVKLRKRISDPSKARRAPQ